MTVPTAVAALARSSTAPSTTEIRTAAPKRSQKCRLTSPGSPERPSSSAPGECKRHDHARGRARFGPQHKNAALPCCTWPRVSPMSLVPRSSKTTFPSTPKVSVAVMQVVIPGRVESMAVSSVQSMKAPFGSNRRCAGRTCARTAVVAGDRSNADSSLGSWMRPRRAPLATVGAEAVPAPCRRIWSIRSRTPRPTVP